MNPTFRFRLAPGVAALAAVVLSAACATRAPAPASVGQPSLSPKLNPFVHFEDGGIAFVAVDTRAAQYVNEERIFPLGIGVGNRTKGSFVLGRESFVLEDSGGRKSSPASYEEYAAGYRRAQTDARLADAFQETMRLRFTNFAFAPWPFYPLKSGSATAHDHLELGRTQYTFGYLYFPVPEGGIHGKSFTLLVKAKEFPETVVVRFGVR